MNRFRLAAAGLAVASVAAVAVPSAAEAKRNPYTPTKVCGPGYKVVRSQGTPYNAATIYLLRKPGTRQLCATTIKRKEVGKPSDMLLWLHSAIVDQQDKGDFSYYAGPIKWTNTPGDCPSVGGWMNGGSSSISRIGKGCS
jgi:hypothetical protein